MSFFVLISNDRATTSLDSLEQSAAANGFRHCRRMGLSKGRLILFGNQSGQEPAFFQADNGDFAAALGSLIYRGVASPGCLPDLLATFEPDAFDWSGLIGTHVILIRKHGVLHVLGDALGACRIYSDSDGTVWSNSFLAMCELVGPRRLDIQACYEYVINGAVFGRRTLVQGIEALPANTVLTLTDRPRVIPLDSPILDHDTAPAADLDQVATQHIKQLDTVFEPIARCFGDSVRLSFSGGFDSRLMLAMLMRHGARPTLFVYGNHTDEDVRIARIISESERLPLECIDKSTAVHDPAQLAEQTERDLFAFDGWKVEQGLFDFGVDREDRLRRHLGDQIPLNGSLGEIYRNFFYMPDRRSSTGAVISTFYSQFDPRAFTARFIEDRYRSAMAMAMREAIGAQTDELERHQVEQLYPKFRGRFWTGRDAQINQRFGAMFFPYLEAAAISNTARIPIRYKDLGYLQGRMIAQVNPSLARYPSDYGFSLDGPRPLKYRLKTRLGTWRPPAARRLSFRLKHRASQAREGVLAPGCLAKVIDVDFPVMRGLFRLERIYSARQYALIATLEYLAARYQLGLPSD